MKVLVIDDDAIGRRMVTAAIQKMGYVTIQSGNGRHAWETIYENPDIRLVVTDMLMPDMDGKELVQLIRLHDEAVPLPVVILSGVVSEEDVQELLDLGHCTFIPKPIDMVKLRAQIKSLLGAAANSKTRSKVRDS